MLLDPSTNPEVQELQTEARSLVALAGTYTVTTADEYGASANDLKRIKGALSRLESIRKSMTQPLDAAKRAIMEFFRGPEEQLARAEAGVKRAMIVFSTEQDRLRREEQARAEAAARKERERLEAQAAKAAESGKVERAAALEQRAAMVVAPVLAREVPKIAGVSTRPVWRYAITDESKLPREYLMPDEKKIAGVVRAMKGDTNIPGVTVRPDSTIASSAA